MRLKNILLFLCCYFLVSMMSAQENNRFKINFSPVFYDSIIHFDETSFKLLSGDSVQFDALKFYISSIELLNNEMQVWKEANSFHLIDAKENSLSIELKTPGKIQFNQIKFNLGIDSITNNSGAMGGDLDPTKGMYWTWQNGYINFKLEGRSNLCQTRKNEFQFHLGGYLYPFNSLQSIILKADNQEKIYVAIDLGKLMNSIDLGKENQIITPGKEAVMISKQVADIFNIQAK